MSSRVKYILFLLFLVPNLKAYSASSCKSIFSPRPQIFHMDIARVDLSFSERFLQDAKEASQNRKKAQALIKAEQQVSNSLLLKQQELMLVKRQRPFQEKALDFLSLGFRAPDPQLTRIRQLKNEIKEDQRKLHQFKQDHIALQTEEAQIQERLRPFLENNRTKIDKLMSEKLEEIINPGIDPATSVQPMSRLGNRYTMLVKINGKNYKFSTDMYAGFKVDQGDQLKMWYYFETDKKNAELARIVFKRGRVFVEGKGANRPESLAFMLNRLGLKKDDPRALKIIEKTSQNRQAELDAERISQSATKLNPDGLTSSQSDFFYQYMIWYLILSNRTTQTSDSSQQFVPPTHWFLHELNSPQVDKWAHFFQELNQGSGSPTNPLQNLNLESLDAQITKFDPSLSPISTTLANPEYATDLKDQGIADALGISAQQMNSISENLYTPDSNTELTREADPTPDYDSGTTNYDPSPTYDSSPSFDAGSSF